jgi:CO/xanthine dehydrogenase FAD-binding subunit
MNVHLPESLSDALEIMAGEPAVVPIAGGTDLFVHWPHRLEDQDRTYIDLSGIGDLRGHRWTDDELVMGALTTFWDIIQDPLAQTALPLLVTTARQVGAIQIQTRGTWGGNIMNASPAADGVAVLMAYDATVTFSSTNGREEVRLSDLYAGYKTLRRRPNQLLIGIKVPRREYGFQLFEKVGARAAQAITKVGVAVTRRGDDWRVVANSVAPTVCRCPRLEAFLSEKEPVAGPADLLPPLREDVSPIDDIRSTARYRETVLSRLLYFGLRDECPSFS